MPEGIILLVLILVVSLLKTTKINKWKEELQTKYQLFKTKNIKTSKYRNMEDMTTREEIGS